MQTFSTPLRLVVVFSGRGTNLAAIIDAINQGRLHARVVAAVCNRPNALGLDVARRAGIPTVVIDHTLFPSRDAFEQTLVQGIDHYAPDLVVLAGFLRVLTAITVHHYHNRIVNIHPSLLPAFPGLDTHRRALEAGVREHGTSVHLVQAEIDSGPILAQIIVPVLPTDTPEQLAERVLAQEHVLYPMVLEWFARGRLVIENNEVRLDGIKLTKPILINWLRNKNLDSRLRGNDVWGNRLGHRHARHLQSVESDRLLRLARVAAHAIAALGTAEKAAQWLHRPNRALGKTAPLRLLDTDLGTMQVDDILTRIEHGVVG